METRGERIRRLRNRLNLTHEQLGELCSVTGRAVSDWEADRCRPRTRRLVRLAQVLETTDAYIEHGDLGTYREALTAIMDQLDERLGGSTLLSGLDPESRSGREKRSDSA